MAVEMKLEGPSELQTEYVREWKEKGGKVVGYSCVATPVELIEAAGLLPFRIKALGNPDTFLADGEMSLLNCSFCRSCLQLALDGTYDFLDGIIETNGCDHMRVMFENWQRSKDPDFFHYLRVPHSSDDDSLAYFEEELAILRDAMSEKFGVDVVDQDIEKAIEVQERIRETWRSLGELRRAEEPAVTGSEMLALMVRGSSMRAADFLDLLSRFLEERREAAGAEAGCRLMLCGAATDETEWFREIEGLGGIIVADALCFGTRAFSQVGGTEGPPLRRLAEMYLFNLFCPRMYKEYPKRRDYIAGLAEEAGVDGVIVLYNKFCDLHGVDAVLLRRDLEKRGIPVLILEKEYSAKADIGRVKTRIQAFMERIGGGD